MKRFLVTLALVCFVAGCDDTHYDINHDDQNIHYSDQVTHEQQWQRNDAVEAQSNKREDAKRAAALVDDGYNGAFACHTSDGGCLHMSCTTKLSCDYMAQVEKRCATPSSTDPKVLDKIVVKDDKCDSVEQSPPSHTEALIGGSGIMLGNNCHFVGNAITCP